MVSPIVSPREDSLTGPTPSSALAASSHPSEPVGCVTGHRGAVLSFGSTSLAGGQCLITWPILTHRSRSSICSQVIQAAAGAARAGLAGRRQAVRGRRLATDDGKR